MKEKYNSNQAIENQKERDREIQKMKSEGKTIMEIGKIYHLTKQRVSQIVIKETGKVGAEEVKITKK